MVAPLPGHQGSYIIEEATDNNQVGKSSPDWVGIDAPLYILFFTRIREIKSEQLPLVDVDGSYLYRRAAPYTGRYQSSFTGTSRSSTLGLGGD